MYPTSEIDPVPVVNVGPPEIDFLGFLEMVYRYLADHMPAIFGGAKATIGIIVGLSFVVSLFFIIGIVYCIEQLKFIRRKEEAMYDTKVEPAYQDGGAAEKALANRWESVQRHVASPNMNDWKQAIIEADIMLDDILTAMGYQGESVGEKLKRVATGDFHSIQEAWDAHKVRNDIAHRPGFTLTQMDAQNTINLYRKVFEEFYYI